MKLTHLVFAAVLLALAAACTDRAPTAPRDPSAPVWSSGFNGSGNDTTISDTTSNPGG